MHRRAPRELGGAVQALAERLAPASGLARVQQAWPEVARALPSAAGGEPTALREGLLTVTCSAAVWAQELQWMADDLIACVNGVLGEALVQELRLRSG